MAGSPRIFDTESYMYTVVHVHVFALQKGLQEGYEGRGHRHQLLRSQSHRVKHRSRQYSSAFSNMKRHCPTELNKETKKARNKGDRPVSDLHLNSVWEELSLPNQPDQPHLTLPEQELPSRVQIHSFSRLVNGCPW